MKLFRRLSITALLLLVLTAGNKAAAQDDEETPPLRERLFFGGNFGLQFGSITDIQVSPVVGLWVLPRIAIAAGPDYRYYKDWYGKTSIYGVKAYAQVVLIQDINKVIPIGVSTSIFAHLENELLSLENSFWKSQTTDKGRFNLNTILAGGGISQHIGRRSSIDFMALWALNKPLYSIYGNPEIRICFIF